MKDPKLSYWAPKSGRCGPAVIARIDRVLSRKRRPRRLPAWRPVFDPLATAMRPPTWHYSFGIVR